MIMAEMGNRSRRTEFVIDNQAYSSSLPDINQQEEDDPYNIDKMPEQGRSLNPLFPTDIVTR
jgi:hypothetical protein